VSRVLVLLPQPFYEDRGTSIALSHFLRALSQLGQPADVLCFGPGRDLDLPGIRFVRVPNPFGFRHIPIGLSGRKLVLDGLLLRTLRRQLRLNSYRCVHAVEEAAFIAAKVCRPRGMHVIYDMQSSLPEQLAQYRWLGNRAFQRVARRLERWLLDNVDLVVCSAGLEPHVRSIAPDVQLRSWHFPSALDVPHRSAVAHLQEKLGIEPKHRVVVYIGSFARYQGMSLLAQAIPRVLESDPAAVFLLVGAATTAEVTTTLGLIPNHLVDRVLIVPRVDRAETPAYLALADVLVSPRIHGDNLPLKAFDYLITAKPIVASDIPAHRALLDEGVALLAPPTAEGFADAICRVLADGELSKSLESGARAFSEEYLAWDRFVDRVDEMVQCVGVRTGSSRRPRIRE
jgi:glycosyltransferase involved in cell wall biosynthesis